MKNAAFPLDTLTVDREWALVKAAVQRMPADFGWPVAAAGS
jgi:hypothetical protein